MLNEKTRIWRLSPENKQKEKISGALYKKKNKLKMRIKENRRRARIKNAGGEYTQDQILDLMHKQKECCASCFINIKENSQIDHIMPIAKGGNNDISNIQLLCKPCNSRKQAQDPIVWAQKNGRLL